MTTKRLLFAGRLALVFAALVIARAGQAQDTATPAPAGAGDSTNKDILDAQSMLDRAVTEFSGVQQSRSIVMFDQAIDRLETIRRAGSPSPRVKDMLAQAYEYRGRAYYGIGLQDKATESFRALVQLKPSHALSKEKVSPKVVDFFNGVKKGMVGYLAASSKPPGARVTLNGEFLSLTDFFPQEVLAGEYTVEISREGYMTDTRSVAIAPKETVPLQVNLTRTAASLFFVTEPSGAEIWIDGAQRGTTAGGLDPQFAETAKTAGLDPQRASARLEVGNVAVGSRVVEVRKKCYESIKLKIDVAEAKDYDAQPVKLQESLGTLKLTSDPPGARIFVDGEMLGHTPRELLEGVCAGRHRLEVKHTSGKFVQDVVIGRNESLSLDCPIRPTLAFLGVVADGPSGERVLDEAEQALVENLGKIRTLNFITAPRDTVDHILEGERLTRKSLVPKANTPSDTLRKVTEKLAAVLEVQGFLIAVLPEERLTRTAVLHLLAAGNAQPDSWDVTFAESVSYLRFLAAVDQHATLYRPWSGLITVDTLIHSGVPVLRIAPGSPAAQAQVEPGAILYSVGQKPITRTAELISAMQEKKPGEVLGLHFHTNNGDRAVDLKLAETPQELPLNDPSLLYNKVMMDLRQQVEAYPGTEGAALARLNLAICAMHFGDFAAAHEHLLKAKVELPARPGISQGTALYYLGLSMEHLNYVKEAGEFYRAAASFKDATLVNNDGPSVAPLAARRAGGAP